MIKATIDLGTNTCLLLVGEWDPQKRILTRVLSDTATVVRLGHGVDQNRRFDPVAMERTLTCLRGYAEKVRGHGGKPETATCVATSQARDASNSAEFFARIEKETGFRFKMISGDEEARLTYLGGLLPDMKPHATAVIDIGGGSTEFMIGGKGQSVDIGSVRFTERHLKSDPVTDEEFWACQEAVDRELQVMLEWRKNLPSQLELCAVAGTATTLAAWFLGLEHFDPAKVDGLRLSRGDIHRAVEELKFRSVAERQKLPGMEPGRADVLLAGALILWRSMELLHFPSVRISSRGLRYGVMNL